MVCIIQLVATPVLKLPGVWAYILIILSLAGCATMDKDECLVADWRLIGYQDGAQGKSAATIGSYRKDCADFHVAPDLDAYQVGRREGLLQYCVPANGYRLGVAGRAYNAVCPAGVERSFRAAYSTGHDIYQARSRVNSTRTLINSKQQAIQSMEADKQDKLSEMIQEGLSSEQRVLLLYNVTNIEKDIHATNSDIGVLERDLEQQQAQLDHLLNTSPY
jgi:Protein of unknown function (DUF2799)